MSFRSRANSCEHTGETALGRFFHLRAVNSLASCFAPYAGFWLGFLARILRKEKVLTFQCPKQNRPFRGGFAICANPYLLLLNLLVYLALSGVWVVFLKLQLSSDLLLILGGHTNVSRRRLHFL